MTTQELADKLAELKKKYPPEVYAQLKLEPEDILAYVRAHIRWGSEHRVSQTEYMKLAWTGR